MISVKLTRVQITLPLPNIEAFVASWTKFMWLSMPFRHCVDRTFISSFCVSYQLPQEDHLSQEHLVLHNAPPICLMKLDQHTALMILAKQSHRSASALFATCSFLKLQVRGSVWSGFEEGDMLHSVVSLILQHVREFRVYLESCENAMQSIRGELVLFLDSF